MGVSFLWWGLDAVFGEEDDENEEADDSDYYCFAVEMVVGSGVLGGFLNFLDGFFLLLGGGGVDGVGGVYNEVCHFSGEGYV